MRNRPALGLSRLIGPDAWKGLRVLALVMAMTETGALSLRAQFTWTDLNGDHNVTTAGNWTPGLPTGGSDITFGTASQPVVNFNAPFTVNSVTFSGSVAYGITGANTLTVNSTVTNNSTSASGVLIAVPVELGGNVTVNNSSTTSNLLVQGNVSGSGSLTISTASGRTVQITSGSYTGGTTINANASFGVGNGTATGATIVGNVANSGTLNFFPAAADSVTYSGVISGTGVVSKNGTGTLTFSGLNTYSGQTSVSGTLADGAANSFSSNSVMFLNSGAIVNVNFTETIAGLQSSSGNGTVNIASGKTLTLSNATSPGPFTGTISGAGSLVKAGAGTVQFSGESDYTGGTTINGGVIFATNATGSALGTGPITIGGGATLQLGQAGGGGATGAVSGAITNNGSLNFNLTTNVSFGNGVTGTGALQQNGTGTLTLAGVNNYSGQTAINAGTLVDGQLGAFSVNSLIAMPASTHLQVNFDETVAGLQGNAAATVTVATGKTLTLNPNTSPRTFAGVIDGAGALVIGGSSNEILSGVNTYSGGTTINSGAVLQIGNNNGSSAASIAGAIVNNGTLLLRLANVTTSGVAFTNTISGTGALMVKSGGDIKIANANTYSGGTSIYTGSLILSNSTGSALGTGAVLVTSNNTSTFATGGTLAGNASFTGSLTVTGGGFVLPGTFDGALHTITPGTLATAGNASFAGNSALYFVTRDATGVAGTDWSLLNISGALTLTNDNVTPMYISLNTVDGSNMGGQAANFNSSLTYSWQIIHAAGGITGFNANGFNLISSGLSNVPGFQNSTGVGNFFVTQSGNDLFLNFTPVPEPATWSCLLMGVSLLVGGALRQRFAAGKKR